MILKNIHELSHNSEYRKILAVAIVRVAVKIIGEAAGEMTAKVVEKRHTEALNILKNQKDSTIKYAVAVAEQAGFNSVVSIDSGVLTYSGTGTIDSDLEFTVSSVINDFAGVSLSDTIL